MKLSKDTYTREEVLQILAQAVLDDEPTPKKVVGYRVTFSRTRSFEIRDCTREEANDAAWDMAAKYFGVESNDVSVGWCGTAEILE